MGFRGPILAIGALFAASAAVGETPPPPPGQAVFERVCGDCHAYAPEDDRAPSLDALRRMGAERIHTALTTGVMAGVGEGLTPDEVRDVVAWLASPPLDGPLRGGTDHRR